MQLEFNPAPDEKEVICLVCGQSHEFDVFKEPRDIRDGILYATCAYCGLVKKGMNFGDDVVVVVNRPPE